MTIKICPVDNPKCDFTLEKIKKKDKNDVINLMKKSFPHLQYNIPQWLFHIYREDAFVLKDNDNKVISLIDIAKHSDDKKMWINLIATDPKYQRKGLGSKMLKFAEIRTKLDHKKNELNLHTEGSIENNLSFYTKNGWKIREIDPYGYQHTASVHFSKKL